MQPGEKALSQKRRNNQAGHPLSALLCVCVCVCRVILINNLRIFIWLCPKVALALGPQLPAQKCQSHSSVSLFCRVCAREREREGDRERESWCVSFKDLSLLSVLFPDAHFPTRRCINFSRFVFSLESERERAKSCAVSSLKFYVLIHTQLTVII